jgi:hypothetical protein
MVQVYRHLCIQHIFDKAKKSPDICIYKNSSFSEVSSVLKSYTNP